jgi:hypothetical protein
MPGTYPGSRELSHASGGFTTHSNKRCELDWALFVGGAGIISRVKCCPFKITINDLVTHILVASSNYNNLGIPVAFFGPHI